MILRDFVVSLCIVVHFLQLIRWSVSFLANELRLKSQAFTVPSQLLAHNENINYKKVGINDCSFCKQKGYQQAQCPRLLNRAPQQYHQKYQFNLHSLPANCNHNLITLHNLNLHHLYLHQNPLNLELCPPTLYLLHFPSSFKSFLICNCMPCLHLLQQVSLSLVLEVCLPQYGFQIPQLHTICLLIQNLLFLCVLHHLCLS